MRRLGGIDAAFLGMETREVHAHVVAVSVYDPSTSPHEFDIEHAKALILSKLDRIPAFHRRLVTVPGAFSRPYWFDDPDFDIDAHVFARRIQAPGGREELAAAVATICEHALDRRRPPWELHVLTGLDGGLVAHALKMHHAAVDGAAGVAITQTLNTPDPADVVIGAPASWESEERPSPLSMLLRGVGDTVQSVRSVPAVGREALTLLPGVVRSFVGDGPPPLRRVPRLSFNRTVSARRSMAYTHLEFQAVRSVSKATGNTINDVILAVCSMALHSWLTRRGELPDMPVIAGVPVSTQEASGSSDSNQVTAIFAALPVSTADPMMTLELVSADMAQRKEALTGTSPDLTERIAGLLPPVAVATGARLIGLTRITDLVSMPFNLGVSNVPGSREPLYCTGARLVHHFGFGFFPHGAGLNITLDSHVDTFDVSLMTCPDLVDDLWDLADAIPVALAELSDAVRQKGSGTMSPDRPEPRTRAATLRSVQPPEDTG